MIIKHIDCFLRIFNIILFGKVDHKIIICDMIPMMYAHIYKERYIYPYIFVYVHIHICIYINLDKSIGRDEKNIDISCR